MEESLLAAGCDIKIVSGVQRSKDQTGDRPRGFRERYRRADLEVKDEGVLRQEDLLVRALWLDATLRSQTTVYFYRVIPSEVIQRVAEWKSDDGRSNPVSA